MVARKLGGTPLLPRRNTFAAISAASAPLMRTIPIPPSPGGVAMAAIVALSIGERLAPNLAFLCRGEIFLDFALGGNAGGTDATQAEGGDGVGEATGGNGGRRAVGGADEERCRKDIAGSGQVDGADLEPG